MDCEKYFERILQITGGFLELCGANILKPNYRPNIMTTIVAMLLINYHFCGYYSINYYYKGNFNYILRCLCPLSHGPSSIVKLLMMATKYKNLAECINFIRRIYQTNSNADARRHQAFVKCIDHHIKSAKIGAVCFLIAFVIFTGYPFYSIIILGRKELMVDLVLYFTDPKTNRGYIINTAYQVMEIIFAFFGNCAADMSMVMLILHFGLMGDLFKITLDEIEEMIAEKSDHVSQHLRNALLMHQDMVRYIEIVDETFRISISVQIACTSFSMSLCLFSLVTTDWVGGFGFLAYAMGQLLIFTVLGTCLEVYNDKVLETICNFRWYTLPCKEQKLILVLIQKAQKPTTLTIAGISPLNVETGTSIMKSIYSYLMMLLNFAE